MVSQKKSECIVLQNSNNSKINESSENSETYLQVRFVVKPRPTASESSRSGRAAGLILDQHWLYFKVQV